MLYLNVMINLNTNKQLGIILPNTNKALAEVLKNISPQDLEILAESKDLKSIINSLLKDSIKNSKSDKLLLSLLKNNPTLKKLGNVSNSIKDLLFALKSDKNPLPIEKVLKEFMVDIKELSEPILKERIVNSGVFMESKLKNVKNPQVELKTLLETVLKTIKNSELPIAKELSQSIQKVLTQPILQEASNKALMNEVVKNPKALEQLSSDIKTIVNKLQEVLKNIEPINTQITKLENFMKMKNLEMPKIQNILKSITSLLSQSSDAKLKTLSKDVDKIIQILNSPKSDVPTEKITKEIKNILNSIKEAIPKAKLMLSKDLPILNSKLSNFTTPQKLLPDAQIKEIATTDLKSVLAQASDEIVKSSHPNQAELLKQIDKLSLQIDYHQMISHLTNSTSLYMPFVWSQMEEGNINIKESKDDKFYCDIELKLKEYGELRVRLALYDDNQINIYIYSKHDDFRDTIKNNIKELRSLLIKADINPREIRIFDLDRKNIPRAYKKSYSNDIDMGFDIKV